MKLVEYDYAVSISINEEISKAVANTRHLVEGVFYDSSIYFDLPSPEYNLEEIVDKAGRYTTDQVNYVLQLTRDMRIL